MAGKKGVHDHYWNRNRRIALEALRVEYDLKISEVIYLKWVLREQLIKGLLDLPESIIAQLDTIAVDVRLFFEHGAVRDMEDPAYVGFLAVMDDAERARRHREAWQAVRSRAAAAFVRLTPRPSRCVALT